MTLRSTMAAPATHMKFQAKDQASGVQGMLPFIAAGFSILTTVYLLLLYYFPMDLLPPPAPEYCQINEVCIRSDLLAFQLSCGMAIGACAWVGLRAWHWGDRRAHTAVPSTATGRLFGYLPEAELLAAMNFTFQFWDFIISLCIPEHRAQPLMLAHHLAASVVSGCSIRYRVLNYYGIFFLGISELSSVFLVFVDLARYFPPIPGTWFDQLVMKIAAPGFVVCFLVYRVLYWWPVSWKLFQDVYAVTVKSDMAEKFRPGHSWVLYLYLALNLPLGLLQVYWLGIILQEVQTVLGAA